MEPLHDHLLSVVEVLGVLALVLTLVCHSGRPKQVLWQRTRHVHLGLDHLGLVSCRLIRRLLDITPIEDAHANLFLLDPRG